MLRHLFAAVVLFGGGFVAVRGVAPVPPLGPLLEPSGGVWAVARTAHPPGRLSARIPGLSGLVDIRIDDRGVPHAFAEHELDAWRALGWLHARDRLFQLELTARAAAGRLTEWLGPRALRADIHSRRLGLVWGAARRLAALDTTDALWLPYRAYAGGINAYIAAMRRADLPVEYRILGLRPERWEPVNSLLVLGRLGVTLALQDEALTKLRVRGLVGAAAADALFPMNSPVQEPIQPNGQRSRNEFDGPLPPPGRADSAARLAAATADGLLLPLGPLAAASRDGDAVGSNNWTVAPWRTAAGRALLAGDPHLELTLPAIWYEAHLVVPGVLDVAGVTIPGLPGVIIGWNRHLAWSFTNTGADVRDLYVETVEDSLAPTRYRLDGTWKTLDRRIEVFRNRRGDIIGEDTVYYTHRGPMTRVDGRWVSARWTMLEPSPVPGDLLQLDKARGVAEWLDSWRRYLGPAQNGVVADRRGTIAIRSTGWFPLRPGDGRGDLLRDGSLSASDWTGYWPLEYYPLALNPAQGFLASANQQPVDPRVNPRYLGADWPVPWRAIRINDLLRADSAVTPDAMRRFQTDLGSARVGLFLPFFLEAGRTLEAAKQGDDSLRLALRILAGWDGRYAAENRSAVVFEAAVEALRALVWDELRPAPDQTPAGSPGAAVLYHLLHEPESLWWDDRATAGRETRDDILAQALRAGLRDAIRAYGPPESSGWEWGRVRRANIYHLLRIEPFSSIDQPVLGGPGLLSPSSGDGTHGASWRMVVELGDEVRAWAMYPGGQSGNPASPWYQDRIPKWSAGVLDTVLFPRTAADLPAGRLRAIFTLRPVSR